MGRRPSFDHWHRRSIVLADGDMLTWLVIDGPEPAWCDCFRLASRGAIHASAGMALLAAAHYPDAVLDARSTPTFDRGHVG